MGRSRMMPQLYTYAIRYLERRIEECKANGHDDIAESYKMDLEEIRADKEKYFKGE